MARAIAAAKETEPSLAVMTETCLCSYTEDGTCYITDRQRRPDLVATLAVTSAQAVAHADAGADIVGPASMVPGVTRGVRAALNESGHTTVGVMPHVIFRSSLYEGYRRTMGAAPRPGADREFQVGTSKPNQFIDVALRHVEEGADMLLLEPALFCVDVLVALKARALVPVMPFSVSGEYTMLTRPDSVTGKRDTRVLAELFTMLKRAGADATITYAALDLARTLPGGG
jgi:porphobilinogen synthase